MTLLLNPYAWLAVIAYSAVLVVTSYMYGGKHARDDAKAAHLEALNTVIELAEENRQLDAKEEEKNQQVRTITRVEFRDRIVKVEESINANPSDCVIPEPRRLLINDAIDQANKQISPKP